MVRIRKVWEEYKIEYQSAYEKMQEEFASFIQCVKSGKKLESLPPAKYSHPPPYPQEAMPPGPPGPPGPQVVPSNNVSFLSLSYLC